jgi:hypothetical protein
MKHENTGDRKNQEVILFAFQRHLAALGVTVSLRETSMESNLPYDAEVWVNGLYTGILEVKNINYRSDEVEAWGTGLMVKKLQLGRLREAFYRTSAVTEKGYWTKEVILMCYCKDNVSFAINIKRIAELWPDAEIVPQERVRDNHGKQASTAEARYIPLVSWERFE